MTINEIIDYLARKRDAYNISGDIKEGVEYLPLVFSLNVFSLNDGDKFDRLLISSADIVHVMREDRYVINLRLVKEENENINDKSSWGLKL